MPSKAYERAATAVQPTTITRYERAGRSPHTVICGRTATSSGNPFVSRTVVVAPPGWPRTIECDPRAATPASLIPATTTPTTGLPPAANGASSQTGPSLPTPRLEQRLDTVAGSAQRCGQGQCANIFEHSHDGSSTNSDVGPHAGYGPVELETFCRNTCSARKGGVRRYAASSTDVAAATHPPNAPLRPG